MKKLALRLHLACSKGISTFFFLGSFIFLAHPPIPTKAEPLPPPPPLRVPSVPPTASPPPPTSPQETTPSPLEVPVSSPTSSEEDNEPVREFTFQAPSDTPPPALSSPSSPSSLPPSPSVISPNKTSFYRVEVVATDEGILEQVKAIEPFAFWEREQQIVYAGRFHQKDQAQQRVQELSQKGLSAQIVPISRDNEPLNTVRPR